MANKAAIFATLTMLGNTLTGEAVDVLVSVALRVGVGVKVGVGVTVSAEESKANPTQ